MKSTIFLILFLTSFSIFAAKTFDIEFSVINGYSNNYLDSCKVTIIGDDGEILNSGLTNKNGEFKVENIKSKRVFIIFKDADDNFFENSLTVKNNKSENNFFVIYMYPTEKYESEMFRIEDRIYGPVVKSKDFDSIGDNEKNDQIIDSLAFEAQFPDGVEGLQSFISKNVIYPRESIEMNEQGKVYIEYVVEKDGFLSHVKVLRGATLNLDNEAKRLIRSMPHWIPGKDYSGKEVRTLCKLPINFTLK